MWLKSFILLSWGQHFSLSLSSNEKYLTPKVKNKKEKTTPNLLKINRNQYYSFHRWAGIALVVHRAWREELFLLNQGNIAAAFVI